MKKFEIDYSVRNLHRENIQGEKIYYNSPKFIGVLASLGIEVECERDKQAIKRFIMGEKLTPIAYPIRASVTRHKSVDVDIDHSVVSDLEEIKNVINGFDNITKVESIVTVFVEYTVPESDEDFNAKVRRYVVFNNMLEKKDAIYNIMEMLNEMN